MVENGLYGRDRFLVVHPAQNANCASAIRTYQKHLVPTEPDASGFQAVILEECLIALDAIDQKTANILRNRYLDFAHIDRAIFGE